jgi:hypothetical protein
VVTRETFTYHTEKGEKELPNDGIFSKNYKLLTNEEKRERGQGLYFDSFKNSSSS